MDKLIVTILAGGLGKRMQSTLPKVLHKVHGKPMLVRIIEQAHKLNPHKILIVVGQYKPIIEETLNGYVLPNNIEYAIQDVAQGTGDAVKCTIDHLDINDGYNLILNGDTPCLTYETIKQMCDQYVNDESDLQITSINLPNPTGCGRIIKNSNGVFQSIVEEKDCTDEQRQIKLVNVGIYVVSINAIKKYIPQIKNNNAQNEYYLTDIVELYLSDNPDKIVGLVELSSDHIKEIANVNTKEQLDELNKLNKI